MVENNLRDRPEEGSEFEMQSQTVCPECGGSIGYDEEHGESSCENCGLIVDAEEIDHGPEWRAFHSDERDSKSRVGAPTSELKHDRGLSTTIGWQDKDAYGRSISAKKRSQLHRLRTWDERFRTKDSHERNLKQALGEIERMASALGLPKPVRETAGALYRRAVKENLLPGRSIEGVASASLYAAARQHNSPRSLYEVATVSRVEKLRIQRAYRYLSQELSLEIKPTDPNQFVRQFASALDVSEEAERVSHELLEVAKEQGAHSGKSPTGLAAAALYAATHLTNEQLTQETVGNAANVSQITIRNRYQELLDIYATQEDTPV
ncbi:transcription initiation factor IIB [Halorarius litoreus]|jgi:transcription initiation factor TFIIB|uniref:transcription initiation factor IIB n=1 Tax=Halorarius litoreus TaxID=2962676 RepID=UPI003D9CA56C